MAVDPRRHWDEAYEAKPPQQVSWYQAVPRASLDLIGESGVGLDEGIVDVGGGASRLASELILAGRTDVTVADVSDAALRAAREESGESADAIHWVLADIRNHDFVRRFELWHDRAAFHFMVADEDRDGYLASLRRALVPDGHLVLSTFAPDGPERCSGLPVRRYCAEDMAELLPDFELVRSHGELHHTPAGTPQRFRCSLLRRRD
jgi:SAM-dependent methyltransferase